MELEGFSQAQAKRLALPNPLMSSVADTRHMETVGRGRRLRDERDRCERPEIWTGEAWPFYVILHKNTLKYLH